MRVAILAHEKFPGRAKTAIGVLRYADHEVVAVIDREQRGSRVRDHVPDVQDAPIVGRMADVPEAVDALLIGVSPIGGAFDESWRGDVRAALERGCDVTAGLHYFLSEDEEFAALAAEHGCSLNDLRKPPDDLGVADGVAGDVDATVLTTVGTDCAVGKMTVSMELRDAAQAAGHDAAVVPTGQTGIMIEGWGIAVDRVVGDFAAGAVERMVVEAAADHDVLIVEGQGSIAHPAYSGVTTSILHGSMPDAMVLCHDASREVVHGYESFELPEIEEYVALYESLAGAVAPAPVAAGALNTSSIEADAPARDALAAYGDAIDAPAVDAVRFDADAAVEALL